MALVLEYLARAKQKLSQVIAGIPRYAIHKEKVAMDRTAVTAAIAKLNGHEVTKGAELITLDGLKLVWPDRWVHLRASGTEPVSRIIAEAPTVAEAGELAARIRAAVGAAVVHGH
jgi:phosphomannomutase